MTEPPVASPAEAGTVELRSFVALPLPARVQGAVLEAAQGLGAALPDVKWARKAENLHVTLKFLGDVTANRLETLAAALQALQTLTDEGTLGPAFPLTVRGFGAFPDEAHAATIWAGVEDGAGRLSEVAASVDRVVARLGFACERRPFRPHVTVGRCKRGVDARQALAPWRSRDFGTVTVTALDLYESRLGGAGSTYVLRGRAPLL
ncbi:MAG TPA: RNA 2',3'-cyclic phosphodiesterase [Polyangia bacterium]|jgi:2'-5' RNA ligase